MRQIAIFCGLLLVAGGEVQAGFIGSSCTYFGCVSTSPDSGSVSPVSTAYNPDGGVTYTWNDTFGGSIIGGQPNLLTSASLDVSDSLSNPVPSLAGEFEVNVGEGYTDAIAVTNAGPQMTFNFSMAVDNTANSNFDKVASNMSFTATGYNASNQQVFSQEWFGGDVTANGSSTSNLSFTTALLFNTSTVTSLDVRLNLNSEVWYSNYLGATTASDTGVGASDASHTLIFQSIQSGGATFQSANGADYNIPEPATWALTAAGALALTVRRLQR